MAATPQLGVAEPLPDLWRAWTQVLGLFASRARRGRGPADGEYESLHRTLVALCDEQAAADGAGGELCRHLGAVARPWVSLRVLKTTDDELLAALYSQCLELDRDLHGGRELREGLPGWVVPTGVGVAVAVVLGIGLLTGLFGWAAEKGETWILTMRLWCVQRTTAELVLLAVVVVVALGGVIVSWTRRV